MNSPSFNAAEEFIKLKLAEEANKKFAPKKGKKNIAQDSSLATARAKVGAPLADAAVAIANKGKTDPKFTKTSAAQQDSTQIEGAMALYDKIRYGKLTSGVAEDEDRKHFREALQNKYPDGNINGRALDYLLRNANAKFNGAKPENGTIPLPDFKTSGGAQSITYQPLTEQEIQSQQGAVTDVPLTSVPGMILGEGLTRGAAMVAGGFTGAENPEEAYQQAKDSDVGHVTNFIGQAAGSLGPMFPAQIAESVGGGHNLVSDMLVKPFTDPNAKPVDKVLAAAGITAMAVAAIFHLKGIVMPKSLGHVDQTTLNEAFGSIERQYGQPVRESVQKAFAEHPAEFKAFDTKGFTEGLKAKEGPLEIGEPPKIKVRATSDAGKPNVQVPAENLHEAPVISEPIAETDLSPNRPTTVNPPESTQGEIPASQPETIPPVNPPVQGLKTIDEALQIADPKARREALKAARAEQVKIASEGGVHNTASILDPEDLRYIYEVGKTHIEEGVRTVKDFTEKLVEDVGEWAREHADKAWQRLAPLSDDFGLATRFENGRGGGSTYVSVESLADKGRRLVDSGDPEFQPSRVYSKVQSEGSITPDQIAVVAHRGKVLSNEIDMGYEAMSRPDISDVDRAAYMAIIESAQKELDQVFQVGHVAQKQFHQTGQALQVAFKRDYSFSDVMTRAKAYDENLSPAQKTKLEATVTKLNKAKGNLTDAESKVKAKVEGAVTSKPPSRTSVPREKAVARVRDLLGLGKPVAQRGPINSKKAGAFTVPKGRESAVTKEVNSLLRSYIEGGAKNLDDVVKNLTNDIPELTRDDVLSLLSGEYKEAKLTVDVHKLQIDQSLRTIKRNAENARKQGVIQYLGKAGDAAISLQRQMQTGLDASLSFIQGLPGLQVSPTSWGRAWAPFANIMLKGEGAVVKESARLMNDPAFKYAKKAGVPFTEVSGPYSMQEEVLLGHLAENARSSKIPVVKQYFETLARTQEGGTAFLNKLRLELFKKLTAGHYGDAEVMQDAAHIVSIITGRGSGQVAQALSAKGFAHVAYAPRFAYSKWQNSMLPLTLPFKMKTAQGLKAGYSVYAKQLAMATAVPFIAKGLGMEVDTDPNSANFGAITLPNGGQLRLFKNFTEPYTLLAQMFQGKKTTTGTFHEPNFYNNTQNLGQYVTGKMAPVIRQGFDQAAGSKYGPDGPESFDIGTPEGMKKAGYEMFVPIAVQQALESGKQGDGLGFFLSLLGIDYKPKKNDSPDKR